MLAVHRLQAQDEAARDQEGGATPKRKAPPQGRGHFLLGWRHSNALVLSFPRQRPQPRPRLVAEQSLRHLLGFKDLHGVLQQMQHEPGLNIQTLNVGWTARGIEKPRRSRDGALKRRLQVRRCHPPVLLSSGQCL